MKHDITEQIGHCTACHGYFVLGVEGDGDQCDRCRDAEEPDHSLGAEWDHLSDSPEVRSG